MEEQIRNIENEQENMKAEIKTNSDKMDIMMKMLEKLTERFPDASTSTPPVTEIKTPSPQTPVVKQTEKEEPSEGDEEINMFGAQTNVKGPRSEKSTRRESMYEQQMRKATESAEVITKSITVPAPTFKMSAIKVKNVISFLESLQNYIDTYRTEPSMYSVVADVCREKIIAEYHELSPNKFSKLKIAQITYYLKDMLKPVTKSQFSELIRKNVIFDLPDNFHPTINNFDYFYGALLKYKAMYIRVYELLTPADEDDALELVPDCTNKDNGLIKLFNTPIPYGFGKTVFGNMTNKKYSNIVEYINGFLFVAQDFHKVSRLACAKQPYEDIDWTRNISYKSSSKSEHNNSNNYGNNKSLSALSELHCYDDDYEEIQDELAAMQPHANDNKKALPCYSLTMYNDCTRDGCNFSHSTEVIAAVREKIKNFTYVAKPKPKLEILRRPVQEVSNMNQSDEEERPNFSLGRFPCGEINTRDPLASVEQLEGEVLAVMPDAKKRSAVIRNAKILFDDGVELSAPRSLFDSGANSASYINKSFVEKHPELQRLLQRCPDTNHEVFLATENTKATVTHYLKLQVQILDEFGDLHFAKLKFNVLPLSMNDLIIGWPDIVGHFGRLFIDMVLAAMKQAREYVQTIEPEPPPIWMEELRYPWSMPIDEHAPEDEDTPMPCSFPEVLHFMEMSPEQAHAEFLDQFEKHISPGFAAATPVCEWLREEGYKAFVPQSWDGINGLEPLELNWKPTLPVSMKPRARPVNPRIFDVAHKEFTRLAGYMYRPSDSPICSPLVVAPKATSPFVRLCGDYVDVNKHVDTGHTYIHRVIQEFDKAGKFSMYVDLDLTNAFHQIKLGPVTSRNLSIQTVWGQVEPMFLPEGVAPASGVLHKTMCDIFAECDEWSIVLFDNILLLAHDYNDAFEKLKKVVGICVQRNLYLKFSKSWLGFDEVTFFGYLVKKGTYEMSAERKASIMKIERPHSAKGMQSFLGASVFFKNHVQNYSEMCALLNDMTHKTFVWDANSWTPVLVKAFEDFKKALSECKELHIPDYNLRWELRADASMHGIGWALIQFAPQPDGTEEEQVITFGSEKFSGPATRWTTIEQECYALFRAIFKLQYYLRGKSFTLATDHNNLRWMEQSLVPKIIRWRIFMQSFDFVLRHIIGKNNNLADWLSRQGLQQMAVLFMIEEEYIQQRERCEVLMGILSETQEDMLDHSHGHRMGHPGTRGTYRNLNKHFPGHGISYQVVADYVNGCWVCQKDRLQGKSDRLASHYRTIMPEHPRKRVGVDTLVITPADMYGFCYLIVITVIASGLTILYAAKDKKAETMADALFKFFIHFGVYEELVSDPGSDLTSDVVEHLNKYLGIRHVFSLVDRHQSNGVEGKNKLILRYLKATLADDRVQDRWSEPRILGLVGFILNDEVYSETGISPFTYHFGSKDSPYFKLAQNAVADSEKDEYLKALDADLQLVRKVAHDHRSALVAARRGNQTDENQNKYQAGDFVLFELPKDRPRETKLTYKFEGPYKVIEQRHNDVECKHMNTGVVKKFHVDSLKIFHGDEATARQAARLDFDQHVIKKIVNYRGDPDRRTTMEFEVLFEDGTKKWLTYTMDLFDSIPFEDYCNQHPQLVPLQFSAVQAQNYIRKMNEKVIECAKPGQVAYLDLRWFSDAWYRSLNLPRTGEVVHVLKVEFKEFTRKERKINILVELTGDKFSLSHFVVYAYLHRRVLDATMVLVDKQFAQQYPQVLPDATRQALLKKWSRK